MRRMSFALTEPQYRYLERGKPMTDVRHIRRAAERARVETAREALRLVRKLDAAPVQPDTERQAALKELYAFLEAAATAREVIGCGP